MDLGTDDARPPTRKRVTTREIAARAGVSRATVSYVLNPNSGYTVAPITRDRILAAARDLGHLPNGPARSLQGTAAQTVLALTPSYGQGPIMGYYMDEVSQLLAAHDYVLLTTLLPEGSDASDRVLDLWNHINPAAVVAIGGRTPVEARDQIARSHVVLVDDRGAIDHASSGRVQVEHLVSRGAKAVLYAGPTLSNLSFYSDRSLRGVEDGCKDAGLAAPIAYLVGTDAPSLDRVIDATETTPGGRAAICAHNDEIALSIVSRMRMRGLEPGRDILIIGSDDIPAARLELTTVHVDWPRLARDVVRTLLSSIEGGDRDYLTRSKTYYSLIQRTTT